MLNKLKDLLYSTLIILSKIIIGPTIKEIKGLENLPKDKGFIIAANHVSSLDQFAIAAAIKKLLVENFIKKGKKLYYIGELGVKKRIYSFFLDEKIGYLPSTKQGINRGVELLRNGNIVGIFPEGHRSNKEKISKGKRGIAFMALPSEASVVPAACFAPPTFSFSQGLKYLILPKKILFGKPIRFFPKDTQWLKKNPSTAELATDIIMLEIAKLCNRAYEP